MLNRVSSALRVSHKTSHTDYKTAAPSNTVSLTRRTIKRSLHALFLFEFIQARLTIQDGDQQIATKKQPLKDVFWGEKSD